jgi:16S rRNA (cytosine1402-N4)-methyltransferase
MTPDRGHLEHKPVLLPEVLDALAPRDRAVYVDGTFGGGSYSRALLDAAACTVWGLDRDPAAAERAGLLEQAYAGRFHFRTGRFGDMDRLLAAEGVSRADGVALDLGVSSMQIDEAERGFSFRTEGPLDMRMEGTAGGRSAADVVNALPEAELADIIRRYGEERHARRVAKAIVSARRTAPITRTEQLADIVRGAVKKSHDGIDPATRTFQALRIFVNDELGELERGLPAAERLLAPGGRLAVVSFHSLEDRIVKSFLRERSGSAARASRHQPPGGETRKPSFILVNRKPVTPGAAEIADNPRARSAKLRAAERTTAPAWRGEEELS